MEDVPAEAALFNLHPYHYSHNPNNPAVTSHQPYYVQSPSTHFRPDPQYHQHSPSRNSISRLSISILSRYSSSRGSTNSTDKQPAAHFKSRSSAAVADVDDDDYDGLELEHHEGGVGLGVITVRDLLVKNEYENDEGCYYERQRRGCFRYFRVGRNSSSAWICLQIGLRLVLSLGLGLLVFYAATKPPRPTLSIQMGGIRVFELREGVDRTGIPTKILACNASINLLVDNKSKLFALRIHRPLIRIYFDRLLLAVSRDDLKVMSVETYERRVFKLSVGTKEKAMYGAGRMMQDMLESGAGLPLRFSLTFKSSFQHALGSSLLSEFHHKAQCVVLLSSSHYNSKRQTQSSTFNATCNLITTS